MTDADSMRLIMEASSASQMMDAAKNMKIPNDAFHAIASKVKSNEWDRFREFVREGEYRSELLEFCKSCEFRRPGFNQVYIELFYENLLEFRGARASLFGTVEEDLLAGDIKAVAGRMPENERRGMFSSLKENGFEKILTRVARHFGEDGLQYLLLRYMADPENESVQTALADFNDPRVLEIAILDEDVYTLSRFDYPDDKRAREILIRSMDSHPVELYNGISHPEIKAAVLQRVDDILAASFESPDEDEISELISNYTSVANICGNEARDSFLERLNGTCAQRCGAYVALGIIGDLDTLRKISERDPLARSYLGAGLVYAGDIDGLDIIKEEIFPYLEDDIGSSRALVAFTTIEKIALQPNMILEWRISQGRDIREIQDAVVEIGRKCGEPSPRLAKLYEITTDKRRGEMEKLPLPKGFQGKPKAFRKINNG